MHFAIRIGPDKRWPDIECRLSQTIAKQTPNKASNQKKCALLITAHYERAHNYYVGLCETFTPSYATQAISNAFAYTNTTLAQTLANTGRHFHAVCKENIPI